MKDKSYTTTSSSGDDYTWTTATDNTSDTFSIPSGWIDVGSNMDEETEQLIRYSAIRDRLENFRDGEEELSTPERRHLEQMLAILQLGQQMSQCHERSNKSLRDIASTNQRAISRLDAIYVYIKGKTSNNLLTSNNGIAVVLLPMVLAGGIAGALIGKLIGV